MTNVEDVAEQLAGELHWAAAPIVALLPPDLGIHVTQALAAQADTLAPQLCQDADDALAAQTAVDVMAALWPNGDPEHLGQGDWWRTPLGRMCARSAGHEESDAVTHSVAAAMLGLAPGSIGPMVQRGVLDRHPDGGVTRASVFARIARHEGGGSHSA